MQILLFDLAVWAMLIMAAVAAVSDLRTGLISNRTVALGALGGALFQLAALQQVSVGSLGATALRIVAGALLCAVVPLVLYVIGGLGGGDLKLFVAIGVCLGPLDGLAVQLLAFVLTSFYLPVHLARSGQLRATMHNLVSLVRNTFRPAQARQRVSPSELTSLRFAPAIFVAALCVAISGLVTS